jgi:hypothetical protein
MIDHLSSKFCAAAVLTCIVIRAKIIAIAEPRMIASQPKKKQTDNAKP